MIADLIQVIILGLIGAAITIAQQTANPRKKTQDSTPPPQLNTTTPSNSKIQSSIMLKNPYYNLTLVGFILLLAGWGNMAANLEVKNVAGMVTGYAPITNPKERNACFAVYRTLHEHLEYKVRVGLTKVTPGKIETVECLCPYGGEYQIDEKGYLYCPIHGRPPEAKPLKNPDTSIPRKRRKKR